MHFLMLSGFEGVMDEFEKENAPGEEAAIEAEQVSLETGCEQAESAVGSTL